MRVLIVVILLAVLPETSSAQEAAIHPKWELQGTASYQFEERSGTLPDFGALNMSKTHTVMVTPTCGYFVCDNIEVLLHLRYTYERNENRFEGYQLSQETRHQLGLGIGAAYNYRVNSFLEPYVAIEVGLSWSKMILDLGYDSGWGRRQVVFPDITLGARLLLTPQWAGLLFVEYARTPPFLDYSYWRQWDEYETTVVGVGFSVFL